MKFRAPSSSHSLHGIGIEIFQCAICILVSGKGVFGIRLSRSAETHLNDRNAGLEATKPHRARRDNKSLSTSIGNHGSETRDVVKEFEIICSGYVFCK
jgi:hypothetical protein